MITRINKDIGSMTIHTTKAVLAASTLALLFTLHIGEARSQTVGSSAAQAQVAPAAADVKARMVHRRAIEAAVWGMPIVNFQAMRDGMKRDAGYQGPYPDGYVMGDFEKAK